MFRALALVTLTLTAVVSTAAERYIGRSVANVIDQLRAEGEPFAYSSNLLPDDLLISVEPVAEEPLSLVREILLPHGLTLHTEAGVHLVVRIELAGLPNGSILLRVLNRDGLPVTVAELTTSPALPAAQKLSKGTYQYLNVPPGRYAFVVSAAGFELTNRSFNLAAGENEVFDVRLEQRKPEIETVTISASRYEISRDIASSNFLLDLSSIQNMPDVGEDPIRMTQRLPGAAASGASARTHFRGGEDNEIGVMLNGQWLFDPFHVRDYQSVFSAIDSRAISGVEVYTGGFPVQYGDRMSGMVLMESMDVVADRHSEIGVSVFNTSFLTSGSEDDLHWLFSARRGNLDLVIDPKFGEPSYYDIFGEFAVDLSTNSSLSFNALYADDRIRLVLESDPGELEQVVSRTRNAQFWVQLNNRWSESLSSNTVLSLLSYDNLRVGETDDVEKIVSAVRDDRSVEQLSLRQNWLWKPTDTHLLQWGIQANFSDAAYDYDGRAEYFNLQSLYRDQPSVVSRSLSAAPSGGSFALYLSDRWRLSEKTTFEWGLRWDDQSYTNLSSDAQISPRFNLLHALNARTEFRLTWGRYHQSQPIERLQIEDGVSNFWPAQRSDHIIAGLRHLFRNQVAMRVEVFHKDMTRVTPRFENLFNPLGLIPELQPDRIRIEPTRAAASGLEVSLDRSGAEWNWWASYTLSRVVDRIDGRSVVRSWDQRHALQGGLSWSNDQWTATLAGSVHSGWPTTDLSLLQTGLIIDGEPEYVAVPGPRNSNHHPTFSSVDFRLSKTFDVRHGSLLAFLEVSNLFNRRNTCCIDWDIEGESGQPLSLERGVDFWLPLLPAVGILWEF